MSTRDAGSRAGGRRARSTPESPLGRDFYARDAETVARDLVGRVLVHEAPSGVLRARLVEVEAYVGEHDLACHSSRGRTARTEVMFGPPGRAYVYFVYGIHHMLNFVTGPEGSAEAVLVRAAEPLDGWEARLEGPGLLTRAFGIDRSRHGIDVTRPPLYVTAGRPPARLGVASRVGVDYAGPWAAAPLRFFDPDSPHVSRRPRVR